MRWALLLVALCGCGPRDPMPTGYELCQLNDGWYLRTNGIFLKDTRYLTREEAIGRAYLMASAPAEQNRIKIDALLEVGFATNMVQDPDASLTTNLTYSSTGEVTNTVVNDLVIHYHAQVHRQIWISFTVYQMPFRGLLRDDIISDTTNAFKLKSN